MSLFTKSGPYAGLLPPRILAGKMRLPPHCFYQNATKALTSSRYYATPYPVPEATTFAGAKFYNSGTTDSGSKVKVAAYAEAAGGGLGALAKSFGEATLGATAAINTLASSWAASPGMYWLVLTANAGVTLGSMESVARVTNVGFFIPNQLALLNSLFPADVFGVADQFGGYIGDYVDGTYANFPESTGLALAHSVNNIATTTSGGGAFPAIALYT